MKIRQQGLTLIELMIVVVVLAILATIAYPSYQHLIRQTRLANVRTELVQNAKELEFYYKHCGTFVGADDTPCEAYNTARGRDKEEKFELKQNRHFDISFFTCAAKPDYQNPSNSGYTLVAEPNTNNSGETCQVYLNDSGIFMAKSEPEGQVCPGYEEPPPNTDPCQ